MIPRSILVTWVPSLDVVLPSGALTYHYIVLVYGTISGLRFYTTSNSYIILDGNINYGPLHIEVKIQDSLGNVSEAISKDITISAP